MLHVRRCMFLSCVVCRFSSTLAVRPCMFALFAVSLRRSPRTQGRTDMGQCSSANGHYFMNKCRSYIYKYNRTRENTRYVITPPPPSFTDRTEAPAVKRQLHVTPEHTMHQKRTRARRTHVFTRKKRRAVMPRIAWGRPACIFTCFFCCTLVLTWKIRGLSEPRSARGGLNCALKASLWRPQAPRLTIDIFR